MTKCHILVLSPVISDERLFYSLTREKYPIRQGIIVTHYFKFRVSSIKNGKMAVDVDFYC